MTPTIYYLCIKQHNQTFLKYLCKTVQEPYHYRGSGKYWKLYIKKHGNDVATYIIGTYETKEALIEAGMYYSKVWNIVESNEWANLKVEEGDGGFGENNPMKLLKNKEKLRQRMMGPNHHMKRPEHRERQRNNLLKYNPMLQPD